MSGNLPTTLEEVSGRDLSGVPGFGSTPSNFSVPAADTTASTGAPGVGFFSGGVSNPFGGISGGGSGSVLEESVQYFVQEAELEMEGLELSSCT